MKTNILKKIFPHSNLKTKKKGFTLLELMAVMAIILILAAAFVPRFSGYITESKKMKVLNQAKNVVTAYETIKLRNYPLSDDPKVSDLVDLNDLLKNDDINKLSDIKVSQCIQILDTEKNNFTIDNNGNFESLSVISSSTN